MSMINSTVEIKDSKVVLSQEVLKYFENIRMEENSVWIDKYFKVLGDESNLSVEKYNGHHIIPCFTFKDYEHKNRKQTKPLADKVKGNIIKLSIYNHILAHYCLWKIFGNHDSKMAFQQMCGQGKYIDNLTEDELKEIAKLKENCAKKNIGKTASKKKYSDNNKEKIKKSREKYKINNKEKIEEYNKNYNKSDKRKKVSKNYYERHKNEESYIKSQEKYYNSEKAKQRREELNKRRYFDPKTENYYSHRNIVWRLKEFPQIYENMTISDFRCISIEDDEYKNWKKQKEETSLKNKANWTQEYKIKNREKKNKQSRERHIKNREHDLELKRALRERPCYDPIKGKPCTYGQLENRKRRHKEDYKKLFNLMIKKILELFLGFFYYKLKISLYDRYRTIHHLLFQNSLLHYKY